MSFTEDWFDGNCRDRLANLGREVSDIPGLVIEIGSWEGRSTCALANAIHPRPVVAVDTWNGSPGEISAELAATRDVYARFTQNIKELTGGNVVVVRKGWREHVPTITEKVALCFIDAEHTYVEVHDNIAAILPLMSPGGIICGDDIQHPPVREAVMDMLHPNEDVVEFYNTWSFKVPEGYKAPKGMLTKKPYEQQCATPSDIQLHLPRFVEMVVSRNATKVIELGTRSGVSTTAWLHALDLTDGHLWSVDIGGKPAIGDWSHWTFVQGDDESEAVLSQLPQDVDICFIDTSHFYEHTLRELRLYAARVKPGGLVVCHDTELATPEGSPAGDPAYPVKRAIEQFTAETGYKWTNFPECWGLGVIEVA
jgi:predicted O-methyltransferase YrrM